MWCALLAFYCTRLSGHLLRYSSSGWGVFGGGQGDSGSSMNGTAKAKAA